MDGLRARSLGFMLGLALVGCAAPGGRTPPSAFREPAPLPPAQAARACLATGAALERNGHLRDAVNQYERARAFDPRTALDAGARIGVLQSRLGEHRLAEAELLAVLAKRPRDAAALNDLGYSYFLQGRHDEAERRLRAALAVAPRDARTHSNLAMVFAARGRFEDSFATLRQVLPDAESNYNVALLQARAGRRAEALARLRAISPARTDLACVQDAIAALERADAPPIAPIATVGHVR